MSWVGVNSVDWVGVNGGVKAIRAGRSGRPGGFTARNTSIAVSESRGSRGIDDLATHGDVDEWGEK